MADGGVDVQLTEKYLVISDALIEPLRRLEIAAEWFRVAYRMNKDPRQNPHLYRQLAEMKRQIEALETELQGDGPGDDRAVILGSLASKLKPTGKIVETDFAIVLTVANGEIVRFQMLEDRLRCLPSGTRLTRLFLARAMVDSLLPIQSLSRIMSIGE